MDFLKKRQDAIGMPWASTASYEAVPPLPIQSTKKKAGGPKPVMPPQEMQLPAPEEYIPTQKTQPSGGSLSDSIKSGARSFLKGLAEVAYSGAWSGAGNRGSYVPSWDEATVYSNPNSEVSANARNLMATKFPEMATQFGQGGNLAGSSYREIADTYGPDLYKSQYNDYLNRQLAQQGVLKQSDLDARMQIASMRRGRGDGSGGSGGPKLPAQIEADLAKKRMAGSNIESLITGFDPENQPGYLGYLTSSIREAVGSSTGLSPLIENQKAKTFQQEHNRAVESYLLQMTGQSASDPSYQRLLSQVPRVYDKNYSENMRRWKDQIEREYGAVSMGRRSMDQDLSRSQGPVSPQPSPPSSSGGKRRGILNPATGKIEWNQ